MVILSGQFSYSKFKVSCITSSRVISWNIQFYTSSKIILLRQNLNNNHWDDVDMFHVSIIFNRLHPSTKNYPRIFPLRQNFQPPMEIPQVSSHHFRSKIPRPPLLKRCTARKSQGERILGMIPKRMGIWIFKWSKFEKKTSRWLKQKIRWWMMLFHVFFPGFSNKQINEANDRTSCIQRWARRGSPALKRASMTFAAAKNLWCLNFMMYILHPRKMKRPETWRIHPLEEENHLNQTIIHFQVLWKRFLKAYHFICGVVGHCQRTEVPQFPPIESPGCGLWITYLDFDHCVSMVNLFDICSVHIAVIVPSSSYLHAHIYIYHISLHADQKIANFANFLLQAIMALIQNIQLFSNHSPLRFSTSSTEAEPPRFPWAPQASLKDRLCARSFRRSTSSK